MGCDDSSGASKDGDPDGGVSPTLCTDSSECAEPNEACLSGRCGLVDCRDGSDVCDQLSCPDGSPRCNDRGLCECEPFCAQGCPEGTYCCPAEDACRPLPEECTELRCDPSQERRVEFVDEGNPLACGDEIFECECLDQAPLAIGTIGRFNDIAVVGDVLWVSAYSDTYGDLVVGRYNQATGFEWQWVDGLPAEGIPEANPTGPRGGLIGPGPNVGQYTALAAAENGTLHVAYYDVDNRTLKYARGTLDGDVHVWVTMTLDADGDAGRWASISLSDDGAPGIAYRVASLEGVSQLRYLQAASSTPMNSDEWGEPLIIHTRALDDPDPETGAYPEGTGLFTTQDRDPDGLAVVAWYDRTEGSLWWARMNDAGFDEPEMLAGWGYQDPDRDGDMGANVDLVFDATGEAHVCYQDGLTDSLRYLAPGLDHDEWVDDGVWLDVGGRGHSVHIVGDDCNMLTDLQGRPLIVYQDSTMQALLLRRRDQVTPDLIEGWGRRRALRGDGGAIMGAFGFYASARRSGNQVWIVHFVYRNHLEEPENGLEVLTVEL